MTPLLRVHPDLSALHDSLDQFVFTSGYGVAIVVVRIYRKPLAVTTSYTNTMKDFLFKHEETDTGMV